MNRRFETMFGRGERRRLVMNSAMTVVFSLAGWVAIVFIFLIFIFTFKETLAIFTDPEVQKEANLYKFFFEKQDGPTLAERYVWQPTSEHPKTSLVYEYPTDQGDPYYPVPTPENAAVYAKYRELADATSDVQFLGRLGTYKYYNMDQVVAQALAVYSRMSGQPRRAIAAT